MMNLIKKNSVEVWYLLVIVVGYTVSSSFAVPLGITDSKIFSVPYRMLVFFFSLYIIYRNFSFQKLKNIAVISISFFWLLYFVKNYSSFSTDAYDPIFSQTFLEIYIRIILIAWIPSVALLFINYRNVDLSQVAKGFFYTLLLMLSLNFIYALVMPHGLSRRFIFSIYYISYGHLGTSMALLSLFYLLFKSHKIPLYLLIGGFILGISTVVIAGARSPFLAIMVVIPYLLMIKKNVKLFAIFLSLLAVAIMGIYYFGKNDQYEMMFVDRTYNWLFKGDNSLRTPLFERSIEIFNANPLFGGRTHYEDGMYPHNLFLELLMATGLLGFVIYLLKFIPVFKNLQKFTFKISNYYHILFFTIFLQYLVLSFTSYALYSVPEFLYFSSIIIGISLNRINEETESNDGRRNSSGNN